MEYYNKIYLYRHSYMLHLYILSYMHNIYIVYCVYDIIHFIVKNPCAPHCMNALCTYHMLLLSVCVYTVYLNVFSRFVSGSLPPSPADSGVSDVDSSSSGHTSTDTELRARLQPHQYHHQGQIMFMILTDYNIIH